MTDGTEDPRAIARRLLLRQVLVVVLLFLGYCAYYFCRVDLSVGMPLLVDDLRRGGMTHDEAITSLGTLTATGVLAYALGKMFLGGLGDFWGGRRSFLIGLGGAAAVHDCVGWQPADAVHWLGGSAQDLLQVVRFLVPRCHHRHPQRQLSRGRRGSAVLDGRPDQCRP